MLVAFITMIVRVSIVQVGMAKKRQRKCNRERSEPVLIKFFLSFLMVCQFFDGLSVFILNLPALHSLFLPLPLFSLSPPPTFDIPKEFCAA
jgi:hypothetical protein